LIASLIRENRQQLWKSHKDYGDGAARRSDYDEDEMVVPHGRNR